MKKFFIICIALVVVLSLFLAGCAAAKQEAGGTKEAKVYEWRAGSMHAATQYDAIIYDQVCQKILEDSGGRIRITHYPNYLLGDWAEIYEMTMRGTIETNFSYIGSDYDKRTQILQIPFAVSDFKKLEQIVNPGGVLFEIMSEIIAKDGLTLIAQGTEGFANFSFTKKPSVDVLDPTTDKSSIKLRIMPGDIRSQIVMTKLGFTITMIPWAELPMSLQTGVVDGDSGNALTAMYAGFKDIIKYYYVTNWRPVVTPFYINTELWNSLSKADQDIIERNYRWGAKETFVQVKGETDKAAKAWQEAGTEIIYATDAQRKTLSEFVRKNCWAEIADQVYTRELVNRVLVALGEPPLQ